MVSDRRVDDLRELIIGDRVQVYTPYGSLFDYVVSDISPSGILTVVNPSGDVLSFNPNGEFRGKAGLKKSIYKFLYPYSQEAKEARDLQAVNDVVNKLNTLVSYNMDDVVVRKLFDIGCSINDLIGELILRGSE